MIYEPREDSYLIKKHVRSYSKGRALDMGTGTGILAKEAEKTASCLAVDINAEAVRHCREKGLEALQSDLFARIPKQKFDLITFNPPYLPNDSRVQDLALDGGKHGYEVIQRFLDSVAPFMKTDGKILLLFSSLSKPMKIRQFIQDNCLTYQEIDRLRLDFEELYVYLIAKSGLLRNLETKGITEVKLLAKGHRGLIFTGKLRGKVAIKTKKPSSKAIGAIENEIRFLKILNKHKIGPKLLFSGNEYFVYRFVTGIRIIDYIESHKKSAIVRVLKEVIHELHKLDQLGINKEEMHHPVKHILVDEKPVLIDFERARYTEHPQNVTQFCQFLIHLKPILAQKMILIDKQKTINTAKAYARDRDIRKVLALLK